MLPFVVHGLVFDTPEVSMYNVYTVLLKLPGKYHHVVQGLVFVTPEVSMDNVYTMYTVLLELPG